MKKFTFFLLAWIVPGFMLQAGVLEKTYRFDGPSLKNVKGYTTVNFKNTLLSGMPGEPVLPFAEVVLMLPPGESAVSIEFIGENDSILPGSYLLYPKQAVHPVSVDISGSFSRNEQVYRQSSPYPAEPTGHLMTQYLNGVAFALCTFTPVKYNPARRQVTFSRKVTIRITTHRDPASENALNLCTNNPEKREQLRRFAQNPEMLMQYPSIPRSLATYDYLVITPAAFQNEFQPLISMYAAKGITVHVATTEGIAASTSGADLQEKIRKYIIAEYMESFIQYVLLAGNNQFVPSRGFYSHVVSGGGYDDWNIPSDLYYSGLDGDYDSNGNHIYGETTDNPDLLPDVSVGRMPVADTAELHHMLSKTIAYQTNPVTGEFNRPLLAGEFLYASPMTFGGSYMNLLAGDHSDNGYFTHGIPPAQNNIRRLYDSLIPNTSNVGSWSAATLLAKINSGCSFIHHLGHSNTSYMLRLYLSDITNQNFSQVNGINHNFTILYTQGCYSGAFDQSGCIASKAVTISNFLVAGVFNSRYGWFDEGTTEGPSEHLEREFVSSIYNDTVAEKHIGTAHMISKIKTAPWISLPGEFEPGAQRWCHYCCNVFGDPALEIRTADPESYPVISWTGTIDSDWNKPGNWSPSLLPTSLYDVIIPLTPNKPVVNSINSAACHNLTIQGGTTVTVNTGKTLFIRGNAVLEK